MIGLSLVWVAVVYTPAFCSLCSGLNRISWLGICDLKLSLNLYFGFFFLYFF